MTGVGPRTLRGKFMLLALITALLATVALGSLNYLQVHQTEVTAAERQLQLTAARYSDRLLTVFREMRLDAEVLADSPGIQGIVRTVRSGLGHDPIDGWPEILWRTRLAQNFERFLRFHPHYSQLRYIGRDNGWRELVRVNQTDGLIERVPTSRLQSKAGEPYLAALDKLQAGQSYFSRVSYNREAGHALGPPTIRFVLPVHDAAGDLFGVLVINADFEQIMRAAALEVHAPFEVTAITDSLDYMRWTATGQTAFRFHSDADWTPPAQADLMRDPKAIGAVREVAGRMIYTQAVFEPGETTPFGLVLTTTVPRSFLFQRAQTALWQALGLGGVILALTTALAWWAGDRLTRPLRGLVGDIRARDPETGELPDTDLGSGEVGELAASFRQICNELIRERVRSRAVFRGAADGIITISARGVIEDVNAAAELLFDYPAEALRGRPLTDLMPQDVAGRHQDFVDGANAGAARDGHTMAPGREVFGLRRDGSPIALDISVSRVAYDGQEHFIGIVRDVSERRAAQKKTEELVGALQRSNEELDKFAYVASHDLKAPLRVIENASRWLEEDLQAHLTEDTRESMDMLRGRVRRMERLLDDLLAHSRIGRVAQDPALSTGTDLEAAIRGLIDLPDGFTFEVSDRFRRVRVPRLPILGMLLNLVGNAIKHHDRPRGNVGLDLQEEPGRLCFVVRDDGPGIAPEYHDKVFEIFQTLRPRDEVDGSGIGLAMVLKNAQVAGGSVSLESDGVRGTTFRIHWPRPAATQAEEHAA